MQNPKELTFLEHLEELRSRLIRSLVGLAVACVISYPFVDPLLALMSRPWGQFYFFSPHEAFEAHLSLAILGGFILASPLIFFEIWQFLSAAVSPEAKRNAGALAAVSFLLFLVGCSFAYFVVLPFSSAFLLSFSSDALRPMISVSRYLSFATSLVLAFGVIFEFPLVMLFLIQTGIATPEFLIQKRKYAVVAILIVSAILTPPDWISQLLMSLPLMGLYELSIVFAKWHIRGEAKRAAIGKAT